MIPILDGAGDARGRRRRRSAAGPPRASSWRTRRPVCAAALGRAYPDWQRVAVVCGPGNNGGDGLAAARLLAERGLGVALFTLADPSALLGRSRDEPRPGRAAGLRPVSLAGRGGFAALERALRDADGVVDALFGTGLSRPLSGDARRAVRALNGAGRPVVSADVPSGASSDGGAVPGAAVRASLTVAFGAPKLCHVLPPASGLCGRLVVADIGISRAALERRARRLWLAEESDVRSLLPPRPLESHKADFGRLAIVAGSRGKAGAAILAARGALRGGAGLVTVFCAESLEDVIVGALPEAMTFGLPEADGALAERGAVELLRALEGFDAVVVGPGLGTSPGTVRFLEELLSRIAPAGRGRRRRAERLRRAGRLLREAPGPDPPDAPPGRGRAPAVELDGARPGRPSRVGTGAGAPRSRRRRSQGSPHARGCARRGGRGQPDRDTAPGHGRLGGRARRPRGRAPRWRSRASGGGRVRGHGSTARPPKPCRRASATPACSPARRRTRCPACAQRLRARADSSSG